MSADSENQATIRLHWQVVLAIAIPVLGLAVGWGAYQFQNAQQEQRIERLERWREAEMAQRVSIAERLVRIESRTDYIASKVDELSLRNSDPERRRSGSSQ